MSTHNMPLSIYKTIPNIIMSAAMGLFSKGLKNEFETAVVNEPSVFEPLKFYCTTKTGSRAPTFLIHCRDFEKRAHLS